VRILRGAAASGGLLGRSLATIATVVGAVLVFTLSLAVFAVLLVLGLGLGGYLWWKTRALRRALREQHAVLAVEFAAHQAGHDANGQDVIEGEFLRVEEVRRKLADWRDMSGGPGQARARDSTGQARG
jgi:hypothetical protein